MRRELWVRWRWWYDTCVFREVWREFSLHTGQHSILHEPAYDPLLLILRGETKLECSNISEHIFILELPLLLGYLRHSCDRRNRSITAPQESGFVLWLPRRCLLGVSLLEQTRRLADATVALEDPCIDNCGVLLLSLFSHAVWNDSV